MGRRLVNVWNYLLIAIAFASSASASLPSYKSSRQTPLVHGINSDGRPTAQRAAHQIRQEPPRSFVYDGMGRLVAEHGDGAGGQGRLFLHTDGLGSTRVVTTESGAVISRRDYFPFGEEIEAGLSYSSGRDAGLYGTAWNGTIRFTGKERDQGPMEWRNDYFGARYMSAAQGRFTSPDPGMAGTDTLTPQSWNAYSYALNNPLHFVDPDGAAPYPATSWKVNKSLLGDPQLARVMWTANNYSPAAFQRSIESGEFGGQDPLSTANGRKVMGLAAEAVVADMAGESIIDDMLNGDMRVQTGPREIGGIAPDLRLHLGNKPVMTENIVGAAGGAQVMNAKFIDFQVKATTDAAYMQAGAAQTSKNANAIASRGGVAILAIDKAAWGGLSGKQQQAIMNTISGAKGRAYIQLFDGLNDEAKRRAQSAIDRAR